MAVDPNQDPGAAPAPPPQTAQPLPRVNPGPGQPSPGNIPTTPKLPPSVYIPPAPNRDPSEIGSDWWPTKSAGLYPGDGPAPSSTFFPSPHESYGILARNGPRLAMTAPPAVAEPARQMGDIAARFAPLIDVFTRGSFSPAFMQANAAVIQRQLGALRVQQEQMLIAGEQAQQAHQAILEDYGQVFGLAGLKNKQGQPMISDRDAEHQLWVKAGLHGDGVLQQIIADGGLRAAARYLQEQDALWRATHAGVTAVKKATAGSQTDLEEQEEMGHKADQTGLYGGTPGPGGVNFNAMLGPDEQTAAAGQADVSGGDEGDEDTGENPFDKSMKKEGYTDEEIARAHEVFGGGDIKLNSKGSEYARVNHIEQALNKRVRDIASSKVPDDPEHPEKSKIEQIRRVDPDMAADMEGLKDYKIDPATEQLKGGRRAELVRLTSQVFPGYKQGFYKEYTTQWLNQSSPTYYKVFSANRVGTSLIPLMNAINSLPIDEGAGVPSAVWSKLINGQLHGDPTYGVLNDTLGAFARESIATQTGSRGGTVAFVNQMMQGLPVGGTKAQLRAAVRASVIGTDNIVTQMNRDFKRASGLDEDMPGFSPQTRDRYNAIERMNPYTGKFAKDAPEELKIISPESLDPEGKFRKQRPAWMTPDKSYEPIDQKTYDKYKAWLDKNPDDPRAQRLRHELGVMQ